MRAYSFVSALFLTILTSFNAYAITAPTDISASNTGAKTVGATTIYSSTELNVSWTSPEGSNVDHYEITATETIGNTSVSTKTSGSSATLSGLKAATTYSVTVKACEDASCSSGASSDPVTGTTFSEYWQLQGTGNTTSGLTKIVSDGNARLSATRIGPDAGGDSASRILLYYGPTMSQGGSPKLTVASTSEATEASLPSSYLRFQSYASSSGLVSPTTATALIKQVATGQGVPLSSEMGGKVRLFFEAEGSDGKTRVMYIDSKDGYTGYDFNSGSSGICSSSSDYQDGGGCAPYIAIGVEGDSDRPNLGIRNARQFKLGFPTLDDWRWDGSSGTFMVFTTDKVTGCSDYNMNHGYAVWDGSSWNVQYDSGGCPKLFKSAQAAFPMHIGGKKYKMYYGDPSISTGRLNTSIPFLGPKKLIYADGASSGSANTVDFEDWENQDSARDVVFLWPDGHQLDAGAEGYIDDYHFLAPTGNLDLQVMYMAISNGTDVPFTAAAVLLNPGETAEEKSPAPAIRANGSTGQITVDENSYVSVSISLDQGDMAGQNADWWIVVDTPFGLYSYVAGSGWLPGLNMTHQGAIFGVNDALEIVNTPLPQGDYTFYFGVDLIPNGTVDVSSLYYSSVNIHVNEATSDSSDLTFYPDSGFRKGYGTTNPMAGLSPDNMLYLYYNDEGLLQNTSGSKLATSTDGLNFTDGITPATYLYHPKYVLMPDGVTRRTYMPAGNETARVVSEYITTGATRTNDPGERYNGASIDNGAIGIVEVFPDNIGGYVMLYIGDKFGINNIRRAYSPPGDNGMNFTFTTEDILGDASRAAGSDRNVDQFSLLLQDNRRRLFTMAYGGSRIDSYTTSDYGTTFSQDTGSRITTSDFTEFNVYSLHDPCVVRLADGKYRMYVCARVDYDNTAAEGSGNRYKFVIVSATTR